MSTPGAPLDLGVASTNASASKRASWRPTALLPEPIGPTRKTFELTGMHERKAAAGSLRPHILPPGARGVSTGLAPSRRIFGVTKIRSSSLLSVRGLAAEQHAETRDVAEVRHLVDGVAALRLQDAAQDDRLAVVDQHLRRDLARVDAGHETARGARHDRADAVLADGQVEDDAIVRA